MVVQDGSDSIVIARVRLPKHPNAPDALDEQSEFDSIKCEVETMQYIRDRLPSVPVPKVYAYAGPSSKEAEDAGTMYMLIEGFRGNTLQDIEFDMTHLPVRTFLALLGHLHSPNGDGCWTNLQQIQAKERIITHWTAAQVAIASLKFPAIGSIRVTSTTTAKPEVGALSFAAVEGLKYHGPFLDSLSYFREVATAKYTRPCRLDGERSSAKLAVLTFLDIIENTALFTSSAGEEFSLNHMDFEPHNILVDDSFNLLAVIDWEFAQNAPWQVNYYPMPFCQTSPDADLEEILRDPDHIAHRNVSRQVTTRKMYREKMKQAEEEMAQRGIPWWQGPLPTRSMERRLASLRV